MKISFSKVMTDNMFELTDREMAQFKLNTGIEKSGRRFEYDGRNLTLINNNDEVIWTQKVKNKFKELIK